jgi:hypothetical protein
MLLLQHHLSEVVNLNFYDRERSFRVEVLTVSSLLLLLLLLLRIALKNHRQRSSA